MDSLGDAIWSVCVCVGCSFGGRVASVNSAVLVYVVDSQHDGAAQCVGNSENDKVKQWVLAKISRQRQ